MYSEAAYTLASRARISERSSARDQACGAEARRPMLRAETILPAATAFMFRTESLSPRKSSDRIHERSWAALSAASSASGAIFADHQRSCLLFFGDRAVIRSEG